MTFADTLASWLPAQRWFGRQTLAAGAVEVLTDTTLRAGEPELRHLIVGVRSTGVTERYQVLIGLRAQLPAVLAPAVIGPSGDGRVAYDALHDPELCTALLAGIAGADSAAADSADADSAAADRADADRAGTGGSSGTVRFGREPGACIGSWPGSRVMGAEQSNSSVVFGEAAILKVLRRVFPGVNPDLEIASALARLGSAQIAPPYGWYATELDGEATLLGVLSKFLAGSPDGWTLAGASLGAQEATAGASPGATSGADFAAEARALGQATARLHADMAAAFGSGPMPAAEVTAMADAMTGKLDAAVAEVPELAPHAAKVRAAYAGLARSGRPVLSQRVHGDYHLGQVLRTASGWVALDFEGEPAVPLAIRRAPGPALRDVAGMLRSLDYAARHRLAGQLATAGERAAATAWAARCQAAFCAGYAQAGGMDPEADAPLLRALMLEKAVYEVIYEAHHRPAWMPIPLDAIAAA